MVNVMTKRKTRSKTTRSRQNRSRSKRSAPQLSPESIMRISGIILVAITLLTLLSLLSFSRGMLTERWIGLLRQGFGWGVYPLAFAVGALGIWLFLRSFGAVAAPQWDVWSGILLLAITLLGLLHAFGDDPGLLAVAGQGGGRIGFYIRQALVRAVGRLGMFVVLVTLSLASLVLIFDISTLALLARLNGIIKLVWQRCHAWLQSQVARYKEQRERRKLVINTAETSPRPIAATLLQTVQETVQNATEPTEQPEAAPLTEKDPPHPAWKLPEIAQILDQNTEQEISQAEVRHRAQIIEETLLSFGAPGTVIEVNQGPTVTQFGVEPGYVERKLKGGKTRHAKVKVSQISGLSKDLELALAASPIRIEAPVPGRAIVGIEVPNAESALVSLRGVMESKPFQEQKGNLRIALGRDVSGQPIVANLDAMPHLLIAGATGSGKSICINALIACLLCTHTPETLRLILVDPKMVEMVQFNGLPHLLTPVITEAARVVETLKWATREMERRYQAFSQVGARHLAAYNQRQKKEGETPLPHILIFVDELADIMMVAPEEVERYICRIAQLARATGIHLVIATQRPSVDVVTGLIKANFPARISFAVTSLVDSRVILDAPGAEQLLGSGDMLYMPPDSSKLVRAQGCLVTEQELDRLVRFWKGILIERTIATDPDLVQKPLWDEIPDEVEPIDDEQDELMGQAIKMICEEQRASISLLQRKLRIGYNRAARLIDLMEEKGIVGPPPGGSLAREVLINDPSEI